MSIWLLGAFAGTLAAALRGIERFIDRDDDVGDRDVGRTAREVVAAPGPRTDSTISCRRSFPNNCSRYESEMRWRWLMPASVTGPCSWRSAKSIIAVTAKRPFVVSLIVVGDSNLDDFGQV